MKLTIASSPHIRGNFRTNRIMLDVILALLPALTVGVWKFGPRALLVTLVCVAAAVGTERVYSALTKTRNTTLDLSAAVTGLLLALNLPATIPLWQCVVGSLFAIVIVKCIFGGIGCNLVNPAIAARVFMLVSFLDTMTVAAMPIWTPDTVAGATPLAKDAVMPGLLDLFLGRHGGAIGETCALALLLGGIYLLARRVITWHTPVAFIATVFACSFFTEGMDPVMALSKVLCGGVMIGAIYMATDYTTTPSTPWGRILFGIGCGLMTCLIRSVAVEGVSYAILFMNIVNPYIKMWTKFKVFGVGGRQK